MNSESCSRVYFFYEPCYFGVFNIAPDSWKLRMAEMAPPVQACNLHPGLSEL